LQQTGARRLRHKGSTPPTARRLLNSDVRPCETKMKGDKYAKDEKEYRILPWALGRWLVLQ
jgi:hypothetical protein